MRRIFQLLTAIVFSQAASAQQLLPTDYLTAGFHKGRREELRKRMPENSVMAIFAYPERVFSQDVNYAYHPNPDLYYFSGYKEPDALLLIFKEEQHRGDTSFHELFFIRKRNPLAEQWTGQRLGVEGVKASLGFSQVYNGEDFRNYPINFSSFRQVIYDALPVDAGNTGLGGLVKAFREKANITSLNNRSQVQAYRLITNYTTPSNLDTRVARLKSMMAESEDNAFRNNPILLELINHPDSATLASVKKKIAESPIPEDQFNTLVSGLREVKTPEELALLRKSVFLSAVAHHEVMKAIEPGMSENELSGLFQYVHRKYGAEDEGYPPIVGAGANGCILHYEENNVTRVSNTLVLMDVAAEYHGYSADITRTVPANGKFTKEQKAIYELVYEAQEEIFKLCIEGVPFGKLNEKAKEVLGEGLVKLGIISDKKDVGKYYIHGCSHHMGLDVHDKNISPVLKPDMVITVEPGIYIPKGSPCDPKWWDLAVRIEDDVVIGKTKCEILSTAAPRKIGDVEKAVAAKSVFNQLQLPVMK